MTIKPVMCLNVHVVLYERWYGGNDRENRVPGVQLVHKWVWTISSQGHSMKTTYQPFRGQCTLLAPLVVMFPN
jgi:hypothetical protein